MSRGELLTRAAVWVTLAGYALGAALYALARGRRSWDAAARIAWTIACAALLAHVALAFHFFHGWSQASALRETARQTAEVTGREWGGGLYINYALLALWVIDVVWWWTGLDAYRRRPWRLTAAWHGFLFFIVFNATVVFKSGILRGLGLALCLGLGVAWWLGRRGVARHGRDEPGRDLGRTADP